MTEAHSYSRGRHQMDDCDTAILTERHAAYLALTEPTVGDFVRFRNGVLRRISHVWDDGVQTSDGGSFYLGLGFVSFSGSLYRSVTKTTLKLTEELRSGSFWFFHRDWYEANNGVYFEAICRVWECSENPPS